MFFVVTLDAFQNFCMGISNTKPTIYFYPLTWLKIFVVLKEMLDLVLA
jgi:hypothetical protein